MKYSFCFFYVLFISAITFASTLSGRAIELYVENDTRDIGGPGSDNAYSNVNSFASISVSYSY